MTRNQVLSKQVSILSDKVSVLSDEVLELKQKLALLNKVADDTQTKNSLLLRIIAHKDISIAKRDNTLRQIYALAEFVQGI